MGILAIFFFILLPLKKCFLVQRVFLAALVGQTNFEKNKWMLVSKNCTFFTQFWGHFGTPFFPGPRPGLFFLASRKTPKILGRGTKKHFFKGNSQKKKIAKIPKKSLKFFLSYFVARQKNTKKTRPRRLGAFCLRLFFS